MSRHFVAISLVVVFAAGIAGLARAAQPAKPEPPAAVPAPTAYDIDPLLRETQGYESVYVLRKPVALVELVVGESMDVGAFSPRAPR